MYTQAAWGREGLRRRGRPLVRAPALLPGRSGAEPAGAGLCLRCGTCPFGSPPKAFVQIRSQGLITKIRIIKFGSRNKIVQLFCLAIFFFHDPRPLQRNKSISQSPNESELLFIFYFFLLQMLRPEEWLQIEISKISEKYIIYLYISVCLII